jgi:hypothetical protein
MVNTVYMRSPLNRIRGPVAVMAAGLLLAALSTPAVADPGAPGLERPSTAVYSQTDERPVLGGQGVGGDEGALQPGAVQSGGAGGGAAGDTDASLPFTGFAAAVALGAGMMALLLGFTLRARVASLRRA